MIFRIYEQNITVEHPYYGFSFSNDKKQCFCSFVLTKDSKDAFLLLLKQYNLTNQFSHKFDIQILTDEGEKSDIIKQCSIQSIIGYEIKLNVTDIGFYIKSDNTHLF